MRELEKAENELKEALARFKIWNEKIDKKEILCRNTPEEIEELDKDIRREVILPLINKVAWLKLQDKLKKSN